LEVWSDSTLMSGHSPATRVVVAADDMNQRDAFKVLIEGAEELEFVKLAGTIRESAPQEPAQMHLTNNFERVIYTARGASKYQRIVRPPGSRLLSFGDFFYSPKTLERVIQPIIADMQAEYCKALAENRKVKATWIRFRGYVNFWKALGLHTIVKNLVEIKKISGLG